MNTLTSTRKKFSNTTYPKDLVCFSHLRWNFVYQRPQHLLSRFARQFRVFFIEEPIFDSGFDLLSTTLSPENVWIIVPHLRNGLSEKEISAVQKDLLNNFFQQMKLTRYMFWYYTPMALSITDHFDAEVTVYDCMDELSAFKFAPASLKEYEKRLLKKADIVFTGGHSLYEAKKYAHGNIHPFPSSIDKEHFSVARKHKKEPADQASIPGRRIGFFGVIDERMDMDLIRSVADQRPDWHFVIIGPVVKIDPSSLPTNNNIHYLGGKSYKELPEYLAGWDMAMIPFALNESTKFISPTKTPEYLAAGMPVVSTSIRDVVNPYGINGLVHIADTPEQFIAAIEMEFRTQNKSGWLKNVDTFLADDSWHNTWKRMMLLIGNVVDKKASKTDRDLKIFSKQKNKLHSAITPVIPIVVNQQQVSV
ncbi:MAG: glycosyltransferase family 1 protein [Flavitalea sp.]